MQPGAEISVAPSVHEMTKNLKWQPKYDRLVFMRIDGATLEEMSEAVGLSPQRCSVVLGSELGQKKLLEYSLRIREGAFERIERNLISLGERAVDNIAATLNADVHPGSKKKIHQDKMSFELLSRIGFSRSKQEDKGGDEGITLTNELGERLVSAIEKSAEATRIHEMPIDAEADEDEPDSE